MAAFTSLADMTRWKMSCCGMDPNIIVMAAARKNIISLNEGSGRKRNKSLLEARAMTLSAPPAMSAAKKAMADRPTTRMIIWMKSVTATDHMPPKSV